MESLQALLNLLISILVLWIVTNKTKNRTFKGEQTMISEIKKHQDIMVNCMLKAKNLQNEIGLMVGLSVDGSQFVSVDSILNELYKITTREDLKQLINEALKSDEKLSI